MSEVCLDDIEYQVEDIEATNGLNADYYGIGIIFSENDGPFSVTEDIILPDRGYYNNSYIQWHSSDPETVSDDGKVTPPKGESRIVTLTADVTPTEEYLECSADDGVINAFKKDINLVVIKEFEAKPLPPLDDDILNSLEQRTNAWVLFNDDGTIHSISANYADYKVESTREAIYSLNAVKHLFGIKDPENEYELQTLNISGGYPNNDIMRFFRLQQVYKGVPVYGNIFL
ncbi:MAG: hypothetical protein IJL89_08240, partial [Firmicutes bacterium]|nr:hypothetical protein [Bacillota bacterium]